MLFPPLLPPSPPLPSPPPPKIDDPHLSHPPPLPSTLQGAPASPPPPLSPWSLGRPPRSNMFSLLISMREIRPLYHPPHNLWCQDSSLKKKGEHGNGTLLASHFPPSPPPPPLLARSPNRRKEKIGFITGSPRCKKKKNTKERWYYTTNVASQGVIVVVPRNAFICTFLCRHPHPPYCTYYTSSPRFSPNSFQTP